MRISTLGAAVLASVLSIAPAIAGDQDFSLVNKTGYEITKVFVSPVNTNSWEEDILGRDTLDNGESVNISFGKRETRCRWDMMVVYSDGDRSTWSDINLCKISKVMLYWDRKNQVTRAVLE